MISSASCSQHRFLGPGMTWCNGCGAREARVASEHEDVPIGAVVVRGGEVIARAHNREAEHDPTGHAEVLALREAGQRLGSWRLADCALYVTLEPSVMCAGAIVLARVPARRLRRT